MGTDEWIATATVAEKAELLAGRDFWSMHGVAALGIPAIVLTDGPHGVRLQSTATDELSIGANHPATCFPTAATLASTWDPALVERVGVALGVESRALGVSVLLGPGANIKRTPLCGRNFEYFSEDPLVSSSMAAAWIRGVQSQGVGASLKHYAANNQERLRYSVDAVVDERALREIYLASFEAAVREARPWTVMAAYNRVLGEYATQHPWLLTTVLRDEWGFDGVVLSDWGATDDRAAALRAGLDLQMPGVPDAAKPVVDAVAAGSLDPAYVDTSVRRLLDLVDRTEAARTPVEIDVEAHHALAEEVAAAGSVLLKNDFGLLPLRDAAGLKIAVLGDLARTPRFQGAGSSLINARRVVAALDALEERVGSVSYGQGYERYVDRPDAGLLDEARVLASQADVAIVFVGLPEVFETEGADREHMRMPASHDALVETVAAVNPRTVVVLSNGSPVEMPWIGHVPAVLEGYLGGQESGGAIARMLVGELEPGGRLAETFPLRWSEHPVSALPDGPRFTEYRESVYVGYRWTDTVDADVLFPFGHGLSYTSFGWSAAAADRTALTSDDPAVTVTLTVANTGERAGTDVVQVYVRPPMSGTFRPAHHLGGFTKVALAAGASADVQVVLDRRAFARWSPSRHDWVVDPGTYVLEVAASSRDVRGTLEVQVAGDSVPEADAAVVYTAPRAGQELDRASFEALLGRALEPNEPERKGEFTMNTPLSQLGTSTAAARLRGLIADRMGGVIGEDEVARVMVRHTLEDASLRMLSMFGQGRVSPAVAETVLLVANGRMADAVRALRALSTPQA
ncbi:glycoside hydrolase family 3 C-terminal domain-containing protein [Longivirga aurantiaca]|uniref:Glycoside hydrolase family 3 C-terminal domain-containing protein n=1 Tax=Longivirga aurantiaca TaxID=1837743 RepID=A0ABW1SVZ7_9ACTN